MPDPQPDLGPDDYRQLYQLATSDDAAMRDQAAAISKKLTLPEHQAFFQVQQEMHAAQPKTGRADTTLMGMPPELAVVSGIGAARLATAAMTAGATKVGAAVKTVASFAKPTLKYEAAKGILRSLGVPTWVATPVAMVLSGIKRGATTEAGPVAAEPTASPAAGPTPPVAAVPHTGAPPPTPAVSPAVPVQAPIAAAALKLTAEEHAAVKALTAEGYAEDQVLAEIAKTRPAPQTPAAPGSPGKPKLQAAETQEYLRLRRTGHTDTQAKDLIAAQRALMERFGLPSSDEVRQTVAERNVTGRWPNAVPKP